MYSFSSRVRYSEVDIHQKLDLVSVINYFQDCSTFQSEDIGVGLEYLNKRNRVWILNSWQIVINRFPSLGENITIGTWAYDFKSMYGYRNFIIKDKEDQLCAYANSIWVYMDTQSYRPIKVALEDVSMYGQEEPLKMDYAPRKIALKGDFTIRKSFPVIAANIDTNNHVNNGQYIRMAEEFIPKGFSISQMRAEYKMSAVFGDIITPKVCIQDRICTVVLSNSQEQIFAVVEFTED